MNSYGNLFYMIYNAFSLWIEAIDKKKSDKYINKVLIPFFILCQ